MLANKWGHKPSWCNAHSLATFTFGVALSALSLFPHQEPRFLIPLIVPVVLVNADMLFYKVGSHKPLLKLW